MSIPALHAGGLSLNKGCSNRIFVVFLTLSRQVLPWKSPQLHHFMPFPIRHSQSSYHSTLYNICSWKSTVK